MFKIQRGLDFIYFKMIQSCKLVILIIDTDVSKTSKLKCLMTLSSRSTNLI